MDTIFRIARTALIAAILSAFFALPAAAAHIGNNKADLTGPGGVTGQSVANYSTGQDAVQAQARVRGLAPGSYTLRLRHNDGRTFPVCTFSADGKGTDGCSGSIEGVGFHHADVVDDDGVVVATGTYERRGNCREPQQGASQCEAPGVTR
ncbi:MAG: hypothetical protein ACR2KP_13690 [Egibacteraceae bacterium]